MGLNDLNLPPTVLAALYPSSLINLDIDTVPHDDTTRPSETTIKPAPAEPGLKHLGSNQKNILIVVNYNNAVHLPDDELNFLTNMLTACKLDLGDVAIVNKKNLAEETYKDLLVFFKSRIVFLFGVDPIAFGMPVNFPHYQVQTVANCTFLYTPSLEQQRNDPLLKSKLWVSLRTIFGV